MNHVITLHGCTPEPLGNYLKALGVFRLVAEQADPRTMTFWKDGLFRLITNLSDDDLVRFFVNGIGNAKDRIYSPTPIFAPWGGRPGFYKDGNKEAKSRLAKILWCARKSGRYRNAADTIRGFRRQLRERGWIVTKPKKDKLGVVTVARRSWPAAGVDWFDACLAIEDDPRFGFLYGTGGNEGSADITNNFWELIEEAIGLPQAKPNAEEMLKCALFGSPRVGGTTRSAGQHFPSATDSPNIGQDFTGSTSANPWDVVLMMEGGVLFAGAATKRLSQHGKGKAAFPFMLDHVATGEPQSSQKDEPKQDARIVRSRAEFWMPLWDRPTTLGEFKALLSEGRLQRTTGEPATHSLQAMEAISTLGISKGIAAFHRVGLFERRGKGYYVSSSLGNYPVPRKPHPLGAILTEIAPIRDQAYRNLREGPGVPERILVARRRLSEAFAAVVNERQEIVNEDVLSLLSAVATLEREVSLLKDRDFRLVPCKPLSSEWGRFVEHQPECRLARAIANIAPWGERGQDGQRGDAVQAIRANLLPVARRGNSWQWDKDSRSAVWARGASLFDNLAAVLRRRLIDATKGKGEGLPLWSGYCASFSDLLALWNGEVDEERLGELIHALALIDTGTWKAENIARAQEKNDPTPDLHSAAVWFGADDEPRVDIRPVTWQGDQLLSEKELRSAFALPRVYALLKLCFVGGRLPAPPVESRTVARRGEEPHPPQALEILNLLGAGRLAEAVEVAARKLRAKGYPPIFDPRHADATELDMSPEDCRRLAGMLLIPVWHTGILASLVIKPKFYI